MSVETENSTDVQGRVLRGTHMLPAACTLLNGLCGLGSIHFAAKAGFGADLSDTMLWNLTMASWLIVMAMVFDMFDGRLARMTRSSSEFGAQLDSLCDMVSFGTAPAVLTIYSSIAILRTQMEFISVERVIWCIAAVYLACAALRLARFNVENTENSDHMDFRGLPSPGAAGCVISVVLLCTHLAGEMPEFKKSAMLAMGYSVPVITLIAGLLMVSPFTYPHFLNRYLRGLKPFGYLVRFVLLVAGFILFPYQMLVVVTMGFALTGPIQALLERRRKHRALVKEKTFRDSME